MINAGVFTTVCRLKWGNGCIPVFIDPSISSRESEILDAIDIINTNTYAGLQIIQEPIEEEYIRVRSGAGCSSFIGKVGVGQSLNLSSGCPLYSIVHEFMHAIGIYHEQSRADRDNFITINFDNIIPGRESNFRIAVNSEITPSPFDKYDYNSVMHYGSFAFSKNGLPTINARGNSIGNRAGITETDIQTINSALITCGSEIPEENVCENLCVPGCRNGGICENGECNCENSEYTGATCEENSSCVPSCRNGGICANGDCNCERTGYMGVLCTIPFCSESCLNGGVCASPNTCDCENTGYQGHICNIPVCEQTCKNGGKCVAPNVCDCTGTSYTGNECEIFTCVADCKNGGKCIDNNICDCTDTGYTGELCQTPICNEECVYGDCILPETCRCKDGYSGKVCDIPLCEKECVNGICIAPDTCVCNQYWDGDNCEISICEPECKIDQECRPGNECQQISVISYNLTIIIIVIICVVLILYTVFLLIKKKTD